MEWAEPSRLWLLLLVPVVALRAWRGSTRRARGWTALGQGGRPPGQGELCWLGGVTCLALALAQPRWGKTERPPLPPGHDLVLTLDVSRSMGVEDAVPDRLGLAVEAAVGLVRTLGADPGRGDRVAVVAFAGKGVLRCPLTENLGAVVAALRALRPGGVLPGGTNLAAALEASTEAFDRQDHAAGRSVILFSDGEDHDNPWRPALDRARNRGLIVHVVAVGDDAQGHPVPSLPRSGPSMKSLTFSGQPVLSRRDDSALRAIGEGTAGAFVPLGLATANLGVLYAERIEPVARARRAGLQVTEPAERFGLFLLGALGFGVFACLPRALKPRASRERIVLSAMVLLVMGIPGAGPETDLHELVEQGGRDFAEGRFEPALACFSKAVEIAPSHALLLYNRAATLYQLGRFEDARADYLRARPLADPSLQAKIDYGLGNTAVSLRALEDALRYYDDCLGSTARGAEIEEVRRRARGNRRFVVEQSQRAPTPGEEAGREKPDAGPSTQTGEESPGEAPSDASEGSSPSPSGMRGPGGSGGSGPAPRGQGEPGDRLEQALANVREARDQRLESRAPREAAIGFKDW